MLGRLPTHHDVFRRISTGIIIALLLGVCASAPQVARAETATDAEMETVCRNWLSYMVYQQGDWAGETNPTISGTQDLAAGEMLLARCFTISPSGHVIVPVLKELPPIKAYSEDYGINVNQRIGYPQLMREILEHRLNLYIDFYGSLAVAQPSIGNVLLGREHRAEWDRFLVDPIQFASGLGNDGAAPMAEIGPLLTSAWSQGFPYNNDCPMGDGGQCVVGCVATATSQVMKYYEWPPSGLGEHQYYWDGDQSCGGTTAGEWLYADFSDPYDWANMPDNCSGGCNGVQQAALAELNYEVAVAFEMSFGRCGSGANTNDSVVLMPEYFRYDDSIEWQNRTSHNAESWFGVIQEEVNNGRPMLYSFRYSATEGHAIVCDGWRDTGGTNQYHMNYGWGGSYNGWYAIDNIYHDYDYTQDTLIRYIMPGSGYVFDVQPDGGGDYPTIQAAVDAVIDGDVVELANGTYTGTGNRDVDFHGKAITVRSGGGNPGLCIIDCEGNPEDHRGFVFISGETSTSVLEGVTIRNGYQSSGGDGAGIFCASNSSPTIQNCVIEQCIAVDAGGGGNGGGMACIDSDPTLADCTFYGNQASDASDDGGGMYCSGASPSLAGCIFSTNSAGNNGGGIAAIGGSQPVVTSCTFNENGGGGGGGGVWISTDSVIDIDNTIIAFGTGGGAVGCGGGGGATLDCCDVYGNAGGDWDGCIAGQGGINGNISDDPLFCDADSENFHLQAESPCDGAVNPDCGLIGALPMGCGSFIVAPDGSGDFPTIQAAIDGSSDGDMIELTNGVFLGDGNRDLDYGGKRITIRSQGGDPDFCIIDCEGSEGDPHCGFDFHSGEWPDAVLEGVTITGGHLSTYSGGGIQITDGSTPTIRNCVVTNNYAESSGGGIYVSASQPTIEYCTIAHNESENGGGIRFHNVPAITLRNCTISHNAATSHGGGVYCFGTVLTMENCIVAFSTNGEAFYCYYSEANLSCSDVFGNAEGDWIGCIEGQEEMNDNICEDPMFCEPLNNNFDIGTYSPCGPNAPPNENCALIGACPIGCELEAVDDDLLAATGLYLAPSVPNPFTRSTMIGYAIPGGGATAVRLGIYDPAGRLVRTLVDADQAGGTHHVRWDGRNDHGAAVAGGMYFYQIAVDDEKRTKRVVLIR